MPAIDFKGGVIGEVQCTDCGWDHAQVRNNKRGMPWSYCDSCRSQHQTRDQKGADGLLARMHSVTPVDAPPPKEQPMPTKSKAKPKPKAKTHDQKPPPRRAGQKANGEQQQPANTKKRDFWNDDIAGLNDDD